MSDSNLWLPNKEQLKNKYTSYQPHFKILITRLEEFLNSIIKLTSTPTYKSRVKKFESYYTKLLKFPPKNQNDDLPVLTDILGLRIICAFLQDLEDVEQILLKNFKVLEVERKGAGRTFQEFGYESIHFLLQIPEEFKAGLYLPADLIFEIQLRTILQDAWAEVEHELAYKPGNSPFDFPLRRKLASINASLSLTDVIFQEIRDYQNKLNLGLNKRRLEFYSLADDYTNSILPENKDEPIALNATSEEKVLVFETIDDMILSAIQAHNNHKFDEAEKIYTKIINQNPNDIVLSVVFKHRGMAYFSQRKYDSAYNDFVKSCEYNPSNFRSHYYLGIVLTLMNKDDEAIEQFSKSLNINRFQAHVYFRRALSYFKLGLYPESLQDLDTAANLGLSKDDEKKLRIAIAKKIDIV